MVRTCGEKRSSRIKAVQLDSLRGLFGIRIKDRMTNAQATEMCGVTNRVNERIDGSLFQWFSHIESGGLIL